MSETRGLSMMAEATREAIISALVSLGADTERVTEDDLNLLRPMLAALANADALVAELDASASANVVDLCEKLTPGGGRK